MEKRSESRISLFEGTLILLIFFLSGFVVIRNEPFADQNIVVVMRLILAGCLGLVSNRILGKIDLVVKTSPLAIRASGGIGVFVLSYAFTPQVLPTLRLETVTIESPRGSVGTMQQSPASIIRRPSIFEPADFLKWLWERPNGHGEPALLGRLEGQFTAGIRTIADDERVIAVSQNGVPLSALMEQENFKIFVGHPIIGGECNEGLFHALVAGQVLSRYTTKQTSIVVFDLSSEFDRSTDRDAFFRRWNFSDNVHIVRFTSDLEIAARVFRIFYAPPRSPSDQPGFQYSQLIYFTTSDNRLISIVPPDPNRVALALELLLQRILRDYPWIINRNLFGTTPAPRHHHRSAPSVLFNPAFASDASRELRHIIAVFHETSMLARSELLASGALRPNSC